MTRNKYDTFVKNQFRAIMNSGDEVKALAFAVGLSEYVQCVLRKNDNRRPTIFKTVWGLPGLKNGGGLNNYLSPQSILMSDTSSSEIRATLEKSYKGMTGRSKVRAKSVKHLPSLIAKLLPLAYSALDSEVLFNQPEGTIQERNKKHDVPYKNAVTYAQIHNGMVNTYIDPSSSESEAATDRLEYSDYHNLSPLEQQVFSQIVDHQTEGQDFTCDIIATALEEDSREVHEAFVSLRSKGFITRKEQSPVRNTKVVFGYVPQSPTDSSIEESLDSLESVTTETSGNEGDSDELDLETLFNTSMETEDELYPSSPSSNDDGSSSEDDLDQARERYRQFDQSLPTSTPSNPNALLAPQEAGLLKYAESNGWAIDVSLNDDGKFQFSFSF